MDSTTDRRYQERLLLKKIGVQIKINNNITQRNEYIYMQIFTRNSDEKLLMSFVLTGLLYSVH